MGELLGGGGVDWLGGGVSVGWAGRGDVMGWLSGSGEGNCGGSRRLPTSNIVSYGNAETRIRTLTITHTM